MVLLWLALQLLSYSILTWVLFVGVAFLAPRYGRGLGMFVGHLCLATAIATLDVVWIQAEAQQPGWTGEPDHDIVFVAGVLIRVVLVNTALLPISAFGLYLASGSDPSTQRVTAPLLHESDRELR